MNIRWPRILNPTQLSQIIRKQKNPMTALQIFNEVKYKYPNYHHNGAVYATLISILGNSGRLSEMKQVFDRMKEDSCECKDSVFATGIKIYAKAGLLDEAVSLFQSIPQFNCVNWTASFHTLLHMMLEESKLETFHHLFRENCFRWEVTSRIGSLNLVMNALCQIRRSDLALEVFQEMYSHCSYPNRESYKILMRGLCQDGRLNEATHLLYSMFWRISQKGCGEDISIYRTLLDSLCDNGQIPEAVEILGKVLKKGLKAPKSRRKVTNFDPLHDTEDPQHAKVLINEALVRGAIPSSASYTAMATDLYLEGKIHEANDVLEEMHRKGFLPAVEIYEAKTAALCMAGRTEEACDVVDEEMVKMHCVPNTKVYNNVLKGLCGEGKSDFAVGYLQKMARHRGCAPDEETYNVIVDGLCRDGNFVEAGKVLESMLRRSFRPEPTLFNVLIRGLCSIDRIYEAVMWLEEMMSQGNVPEASLWYTLAASVCSNMSDIQVDLKALR